MYTLVSVISCLSLAQILIYVCRPQSSEFYALLYFLKIHQTLAALSHSRSRCVRLNSPSHGIVTDGRQCSLLQVDWRKLKSLPSSSSIFRVSWKLSIQRIDLPFISCWQVVSRQSIRLGNYFRRNDRETIYTLMSSRNGQYSGDVG